MTTPSTNRITPRYSEALQWAEELHRNQHCKGKQVPYIAHLISVSALLHDAIEDAGQSHTSIAERFGGAVADIVHDCTDTSPETKPGEKEPWLLRKTRYLNSLTATSISNWFQKD